MVLRFLTVLFTTWALLISQTFIPHIGGISYASDLGSVGSKIDDAADDADEDTGTDFEFTWDSEDAAKQLGLSQEVLTWIMMIASAFMTAVITPICPTKIETYLGVAATLLVMIMEVVALKMYEGTVDQELKVYENQDLDKQLTAVTTAISGVDMNITVTKMRYGAAYAYGALYYIAAVLAIVMSIVEIVKAAANCNIAAAACAAACAPTANACPKSASCTTAFNQYNPFQKVFPYQFAKMGEDPIPNQGFIEFLKLDERFTIKQSNASSYYTYTEFISEKNGAIRSVNIDQIEAVMQFSEFTPILGDQTISEQFIEISKILGDEFFNAILPKAYALDVTDADSEDKWKQYGGMIGIAGTALTAFITILVLLKKKVLTKVKTNGWVRGVLYIIFGSFGIAAGKVGQELVEDLEEQKTSYENLKDKITQLLKAKDSYNLNVQQNIILPPSIPSLGSQNPNILKLKDDTCKDAGASKPSFFSQQSACNCKGGKCTSTPPKINFGKGFNIPSVSSGLNLAASATTSVINGDVQGAMTNASELGRNATNYKRVAKKVQILANKQLGKYKVEGIDFNKLEKENMDDMNGVMKSAWSSMDKNQKVALLELAGVKVPESIKDKKEKVVVTDRDGPVKATGRKKVAATKTKKKGILKPKDFDLDGIFGDDDPNLAENENKKEKDNRPEGVNGKTSKPDISERTRTSIFKIIEVRYFKSAYPRFFEEEN